MPTEREIERERERERAGRKKVYPGSNQKGSYTTILHLPKVESLSVFMPISMSKSIHVSKSVYSI